MSHDSTPTSGATATTGPQDQPCAHPNWTLGFVDHVAVFACPDCGAVARGDDLA